MERLLVEILRYTDRDAVEPFVICTSDAGALASSAVAEGAALETLGVPLGRSFGLPFLLARRFRRLKIDLVHTHGPYCQFYGALAARLAGGIPLVHTKHGYPWPATPRALRRTKLANRLSTRVVAVSHDLRGHLLCVEGAPADKVSVIHNGVDVSRFPIRPSCDNDAPIAVMVARFSAEKDFDTLLQATSIIRRRVPEFRLRLIGDGPERARVERLAETLQVADSVEFLGVRSDIIEQLGRAAVYVLSTNTEGLSISLLEAMAAGLPVVATNVGGNPEVVGEGCGYLTPPRNPEALAGHLIDLVDSPQLARRMGFQARQFVEQRFDVRSTAQAYCRLYSTLTRTSTSLSVAKN